MKKQEFVINHLGHLPFNPDFLLDKGRFVDRPLGLTFSEITKLYWTVKSFDVNFGITSFNEVNALDTFFSAGGTSGGIIGATAGLAAVNQSIGGQQPIIMRGPTKIVSSYRKSVRKKPTDSIPFEGYRQRDSPFSPKDFELDPEVKPNQLFSRNLKPNEGSLCSAGPIHTLRSGNASLIIDFSDILFFRRLYWPKIIFIGASNNLFFNFNPARAGDVNVNVIGGGSFLGALIPVYGYAESFSVIPTQIVVAFGSVSIGKRCCDRFFYDGFDEERLKDPKCADVCGDGPRGVFTKTKSAPSTTQSTQSTEGGFVGGGGGFGGGGASATF